MVYSTEQSAMYGRVERGAPPNPPAKPRESRAERSLLSGDRALIAALMLLLWSQGADAQLIAALALILL